MILRGFEVEGFGVFRGFAVRDLPEGLTMLLGPNEAGKSTLLAFLRFMLFGFARGQQQKYPPLAGGRHGGRVTFEDPAGVWTLERLAGQSPRLFAPDGGVLGEDALRERLGGLDAEIFRSVFAFSLVELTNLETLSQVEVRDRLYSAGITGAGRSAASVLAQLRRGLDGYLRQRSKDAVINQLSEDLAGARRELQAALALADHFQDLEGELAAVEDEVSTLAAQAADRALRSRHLERLEQIFVPWNRMQRLDAEVLAAEPPRPIADAVAQRIDEAQASLAEATAEAQRQADRCREAEERLGREQSLANPQLLSLAAPLGALRQECALQRDRLARVARLTHDAAAQEGRCRQIAGDIGARDGDELPAVGPAELRAVDETLEGLRAAQQAEGQRAADQESLRSTAALARSAAESAREACAAYDGVPDEAEYQARAALLEAHRDALEALRRRRAGLWAPLLLATGFLVVGLVAAVLQSWTLAVLAPLGIVGGLAVVLGPPGREARSAAHAVRQTAADLGLERPRDAEAVARDIAALHADLGRVAAASAVRARARAAEVEREEAGRRLAEAEERLRQAAALRIEALAAVDGLKAGLGVDASVPPQHLPSHLAGRRELQTARQALTELMRERAEVESAALAWQARAEDVFERLGIAAPQAREAWPEAIEGLAAGLDAAQQRDGAIRTVREEVAAAAQRRQLAETALQAAQADLEAALAAAGLPDIQAFARWREADTAHQQRLRDRDQAAAAFADQACRDRETLSADLLAGSPELWQAERAELDQQLLDLAVRQEDAVRRSQDLRRQHQEVAESADVPRLSARCLELEEEISRAADAWRAQALAERLLVTTLDAFVRKSQPLVLRVASDAFRDITAGRYEAVRQRGDGQGLLAVAAQGAPKAPEELSRGTQEQLYLALRFGLAASYGERSAALPLVLDDVAVNFDPVRQEAFLRVLGQFSGQSGRQALFFTCHPALVEAARRAQPRLQVIALDRGEAEAQVAAAREDTPGGRVTRLLAPGPLAARELARLADVGEAELRAVLADLVASGQVEAIGQGRGRRYRLVAPA